MAATLSSTFSLATLHPYAGGDGNTAGTASTGSDIILDNDAGAAGSSEGGFQISEGALIAIIVVVVIVALLGIASGMLFFFAKQREWKVREAIRRSTKKVVTALTPRHTEFPKYLKELPARSRGGHVRFDNEVPPTPRLRLEDIEKGLAVKLDVKRKRFHRQ